MPKVTLSYAGNLINSSELLYIGSMMRHVIADVFLTPEVTLKSDDVDFLPRQHEAFDLVPTIGIEIETISFPARKKKLQDETVLFNLKQAILSIPGFPRVDNDTPLIWIKFWDPAGKHF